MAVIIIVEDNLATAHEIQEHLKNYFQAASSLSPRLRILTTSGALQKGYLPPRIVSFPLRQANNVSNPKEITLDASEIFYIEVFDHEVIAHLAREEDDMLRLRCSLQKCSELLYGMPFSRCSQSYLVNLHYIHEVHKEYALLMFQNRLRKVPLSPRRYRKDFMEALERFQSGL